MAKLIVDELENSTDENIVIRLVGDDIVFQASEYSINIYINEDIADKIIFHLQAILQDRYYHKHPEKIPQRKNNT